MDREETKGAFVFRVPQQAGNNVCSLDCPVEIQFSTV